MATDPIEVFKAEFVNGADYVSAHTSGSTGKPKDIKLLKSDMLASAAATNAFFGIGENDTVGMALSVDYIAGKMMVVRAMLANAKLRPLPVSNAVELPADCRYKLLAIVPSQMQAFINHPEYAERVENLLVGGASPSAELCRTLSELGYKVWISYGMTETCSHVALANGADVERIYNAVDGISFNISNDERLIIDCPRFSFKRLETNDVVELLSKHSFKWRGRADGVINSGGLKFFPEELEALFAPAMGATAYYVCGVPDDKWGTAIGLVYEGTDADAARVASAVEACVSDRRRLPKHYIAVEKLPRTSNGKIIRRR